MQLYLSHLLSDIRAAHRTNSPEEKPEPKSIEDHFKDIDRWVSGDAEQPLSYYCGLEAEAFPPSDQLSAEQISKVCDAFTAMIHTWGADIDLPDEMPLNRKYELIVGLLDHEFTPFNYGGYIFDFCTGYAPDCELKEYCPCLEFWEEDS
ncbi:MAG: hypothetical protein U5K72_03855 [Balneolaceae bacterium]|nr:hypothetical protein [Balneolaceae bacterium]